MNIKMKEGEEGGRWEKGKEEREREKEKGEEIRKRY